VGGTYTTQERNNICLQSFSRKTLRYSILGSLGCRWKNNKSMDFEDMACEDVTWIYLTQNKETVAGLVSKITGLRLPWKLGI
jgi:hypothetical protein